MDWSYLFLSFEGRISRKPYWFGILALTIVLTVQNMAAALWLIGTNWIVLSLIAYLILLYPAAALMVKRLHDRNRTGLWAALVFGFSFTSSALQFAGLIGQSAEPNVLDLVFGLVSAIVAIWFLIELGFLKGTQGPNRFGADPLGATQADASL